MIVDAVVLQNVSEISRMSALGAATSELAANNHQRTPQTADAS